MDVRAVVRRIVAAFGCAIPVACLAAVDTSILPWGAAIAPPPEATNIVAISAGSTHQMALAADGRIFAWGGNSSGQCNVPAGLTNAVQIAAANRHSAALFADGTVVAWGSNQSGQTNIPAGLVNVVEIASRGNTIVALRADGSVIAWGFNIYGQTNIPPGASNVVSISDGGNHVLALRYDGSMIAWGDNLNGAATVPDGLTGVVAVAAGLWRSAGLVSDGSVVAWGAFGSATGITGAVAIAQSYDCGFGLSGDGAIRAWGNSVSPEWQVPAGATNAVAVCGGNDRAMALLSTNRPFLPPLIGKATVLFGIPHFFRVQPTAVTAPSIQWHRDGDPVQDATNRVLRLVATNVQQAGSYRCIVTDPAGVATSTAIQIACAPLRIRTPTAPPFMSLGQAWTASVHAVGIEPHAYQWTRGGEPIPGATSSTHRVDSVAWSDATDYRVIVSNQYGAVTSDAVMLTTDPVLSWGNLGSPPTGLSNVVALAAGSAHVLALQRDGRVVAWGSNTSWQCNVPANLTNAVAIAAGLRHSLAVRSDGTVSAWGSNFYGATTPPSDLTNAIGVAAGNDVSFALRSDGTVVRWGSLSDSFPGISNAVKISARGRYGIALLTDGSALPWGGWSSSESTLASGIGIGGLRDVAAGLCHGLGLLTNGTVVAWGNAIASHVRGQASVPDGLSNVMAIAAGNFHSVALRADGTVVSWGDASGGALDTPAGADQGGIIAAGNGFTVGARASGAPFIPPAVPATYAHIESPALLSFRPVGAPPLTYAWMSNGIPLQGANEPALRAALSTPGLEAEFQCVVANSGGAVTSPVLRVRSGTCFNLAAWGDRRSGNCALPEGLSNCTAVAAGYRFGFALRSDGSLVTIGYGGAPPAGSNVIDMAVGWDHGLAVTRAGTVVGVGSGSYGQTTIPIGLEDVVDVEAGSRFSMALKGDGTVAAWGYNGVGQTDVPPTASNVVSIATGLHHALAVRADGTVVAWGLNQDGQCNVPPGLNEVVTVDGGASHSIALRSDGSLVAWGSGSSGANAVPPGLGRVVAVSAGLNHNVALMENGAPVAWGSNDCDQTNSPAYATNLVSVAAGYYHNLAVRASGPPTISPMAKGITGVLGLPVVLHARAAGAGPLAYAWQRNGASIPGATNASLSTLASNPDAADEIRCIVVGPLGSATGGVVRLSTVPLRVTSPPSDITVCPGGACSVTSIVASGTPVEYQWQRNGASLAEGTGAVYAVASASPTDGGEYFCIASSALGTVTSSIARIALVNVATWGTNVQRRALVPAAASNAIAVAEGGGHCLALLSDGAVAAWGNNLNYGQCDVPAALPPAVGVAAGSVHSLVLTRDGTVIGWGGNYYGQRSVPSDLTNAVAIAACADFSLALRDDGRVAVWGATTGAVPADLTNVIQIAAGNTHILALRADGTVSAWGNSAQGQCDVPAGATNIVAVTAGSEHSAALRSDGTIIAWGDQDSGACAVPGDVSNAVSIAAGAGFTAALLADGTVRAWGDPGDGRCAIPAGLGSAIGIAAASKGAIVVLGSMPTNRGPRFISGPDHVEHVGGGPLILSSGAVSDMLPTYRWMRGAVALSTQTASRLVLPVPRRRDSGEYRVVVSTLAGSSTSTPTRVSIRIPQRLRIEMVDGILRVRFADEDGEPMLPEDAPAFTVWSSSTLADESWLPLLAPMAFDAGELVAPDTNGVLPGIRFYRVTESP